MAERTAFYGCFFILGCVMVVANFFIIVPVAIQMVLYTAPIIYIGSHLSLKMNEVDATTGERPYQAETVSRRDAMFFPILGSVALFSLYVVYKLLPVYWVNILLTTYLTIMGTAAVAETLLIPLERLTPHSFDAVIFSKTFQLPWIFQNPDGPYDIKATVNQICSYIISAVLAVSWLVTKLPALHNLIAVGFCIQAIRLVSIGSFSTATILLSGLFIYDIFWVFGTEVMVTVAKSLQGPIKLIFLTSFSDPKAQSILGLGDIVIPGIFIALILRFDNWLRTVRSKANSDVVAKSTCFTATNSMLSESVDIHERFSKRYFICNMIAYEAGLLTTAAVMFYFKRAQPALLYLVPFCLFGLYAPAALWGNLKDVFEYSEEEEDGTENGKKRDSLGAGDGNTDVASTKSEGMPAVKRDQGELRERASLKSD